MSAGISSILSQAKSALAAAQVGMNTTAKNVSNINTEGYSRQRVEFKTGEPQNYSVHRVGGGVEVGSVSRATNEFLNRRLIDEGNTLGKNKGISDIYNQLEVLFQEDGDVGISGIVSKFFNDLRTLSTQPDAVPLRAAVRESAEGITNRFRNLAEGVDQVVGDLDRRIEGDVSKVNDFTTEIAKLNQQIMEIEAQGAGVVANDERDDRDLALQKLSSIIDIQVSATENGGINVTSGRLGPLVVGSDKTMLGAFRSDEGAHQGNVRIFVLDEVGRSPPKDVTDRVESGSLGGYVAVRDRDIVGLQNKLDSLAYNLTAEINGVHREAYNRSNKNGIDFFSDLGTVKDAAKSLSLSSEIRNDLSNIATASKPNASGDNSAVLAMTDLQSALIFDGGRANFSDMASGIVGELGVQTRAANQNVETQSSLVDQLDMFKKEVAGVSLDEEGMDMIKFQKLFDASAKMIQLADGMMDTVINLKRF
jgi:flagellar hook-associated protein 1 FlgK